ncbi:hypothetical protein V6Z11_D04G222600 [Gossypium hirsutum]
MALATKQLSSPFVIFLILSIFLVAPSFSGTDTFVFGGCSQLKFTSGSQYEYNVNSILTSLVNSAMFTSYNNFTMSASGGSSAVYGLFQCRGDLNNRDCNRCVAKATVVVKKCGPSFSSYSDALTRRDSVLSYLEASDGTYKPFRISESGNLQGVAQCVGDLSPSECQDCLSEAIGQLKTECGAAKWGDLYLAKCYVRFSEGGYHSHAGKSKRFRHLFDGGSSYLFLFIFLFNLV